jgi:class 3 adenylate cyclase
LSARLQTEAASPGAALAFIDMSFGIDVRDVLPAISAPTLVLHAVGDHVCHVEQGRYLAAHIYGARYVELTGADHLPWGEHANTIVAETEEFLTGARSAPGPEPDRVLATVLFTDVVGSTPLLAEVGDHRYAELLSEHYQAVRRELGRFRGQELDTAGDGFLASFDGPARAIRCAEAIIDAVGLPVRAGVHTGECEVVEGKLVGLAVHIGARVAGEADAGEVLVSGTVRDLVAGSGLAFADRGMAALKGVPGELRLYAVKR